MDAPQYGTRLPDANYACTDDPIARAVREANTFGAGAVLTSATREAREADALQGVNPKDAIGSAKPSYEFVPIEVLYGVGAAMTDGAQKYGPFNWRQTNVRSMVYVNAARRHIDAWAAGEETASDSGCHHLDHAIAGLMILRDAQLQDCMVDTRHTPPKRNVYNL